MQRQLTESEKEEILSDHIPYKLTQLRHHHYYKSKIRLLFNNDTLYRRHEICAIEIGFVAGRLFLEFLGLSYDKLNKQIYRRNNPREDDLLITDFGFSFVETKDLTATELEILAIFYNRANKGSGHFTWEEREEDGFASIDDGTIIIERLLQKFLYAKLGRKLVEK